MFGLAISELITGNVLFSILSFVVVVVFSQSYIKIHFKLIFIGTRQKSGQTMYLASFKQA